MKSCTLWDLLVSATVCSGTEGCLESVLDFIHNASFSSLCSSNPPTSLLTYDCASHDMEEMVNNSAILLAIRMHLYRKFAVTFQESLHSEVSVVRILMSPALLCRSVKTLHFSPYSDQGPKRTYKDDSSKPSLLSISIDSTRSYFSASHPDFSTAILTGLS